LEEAKDAGGRWQVKSTPNRGWEKGKPQARNLALSDCKRFFCQREESGEKQGECG